MAFPTNLHPHPHRVEICRQEAQVNPGLWKLIVAAAAILLLLVGAMEVFKEPEKGLAFQTPAGHLNHPSSL
ncbi:hypothetical protein EPK99_12120 [Neorhizobium lilium]|uniref:Uncharacterized protein n=1 Tax=Neorhizobium lilium TaxID=2503024 RepID=A0A3S3VQ28_9HYPH|nr:hypothetical protein [Neorhizobium lilium]RWX79292.1 hypothetical protein EPK99_12120 [Neorhizobium lilium]